MKYIYLMVRLVHQNAKKVSIVFCWSNVLKLMDLLSLVQFKLNVGQCFSILTMVKREMLLGKSVEFLFNVLYSILDKNEIELNYLWKHLRIAETGSGKTLVGLQSKFNLVSNPNAFAITHEFFFQRYRRRHFQFQRLQPYQKKLCPMANVVLHACLFWRLPVNWLCSLM